MKKTNVERILEQSKVNFTVAHYEPDDGKIDGVSVAEKVGKPVDCVYKTLVTIGQSKQLYVLLIPVAENLDLKKAAKVCGEKSIDMLPVKDIEKHTGYIRGGCSPIGMKKKYKTFIHETAAKLVEITVSGGKIGTQVSLDPEALRHMVQAEFADLITI
ncbi:MAG: aminoacyl-tRNA deacylase [Clostridiales bacterium 38-18]|nr:MAG: aminoacyl-tRNA deacylase [Clostridiales bacterium 38-18]